jgi:hypothetical protein
MPIYSNLFQACFSYSTILCLRFLGLQKIMLQAVNEAEKKLKRTEQEPEVQLKPSAEDSGIYL